MISIKSHIEFSLLDWPGRIASVIFLPGCNFRCPFCHNHALVLEPDSLEDIPIKEVIRNCRERAPWIDGIVVSGGEPTIHPWLPDMLEILKENDLCVKLDTNGSRPAVLMRLIKDGLVDHIAMDVKAPLDKNCYSIMAGVPVDIEAIRGSIDLLIFSGIEHTFRTTVVPGRITEADIVDIAGKLTGSSGLVLQNFKPEHALDPALRSVKIMPEEELQRLSSKIDSIICSGRQH